MRRRLRLGAAAALLGVLASQAGCGSVVNLWLGTEEGEAGAYGGSAFRTEPFGGLRNDFHGLDEAVHGTEGFWFSLVSFPFFAFIDLPLSLAADTLTLPYTVPCLLRRQSSVRR